MKVAHIELTVGTESNYMQSKSIDHTIDLVTRKFISSIREVKAPTKYTIVITANEIE